MFVAIGDGIDHETAPLEVRETYFAYWGFCIRHKLGFVLSPKYADFLPALLPTARDRRDKLAMISNGSGFGSHVVSEGDGDIPTFIFDDIVEGLSFSEQLREAMTAAEGAALNRLIVLALAINDCVDLVDLNASSVEVVEAYCAYWGFCIRHNVGFAASPAFVAILPDLLPTYERRRKVRREVLYDTDLDDVRLVGLEIAKEEMTDDDTAAPVRFGGYLPAPTAISPPASYA